VVRNAQRVNSDDFDESTVRTISETSRTLGFGEFGFWEGVNRAKVVIACARS
jgi:hypothetical protein